MRRAILGLLLSAGLGLEPAARADDPPPMVVRRLDPAPGPLANPFKGWCPYTDAGSIRQPYAMVYHYASWRELEPVAGEYRFDEWEARAWDVPAGRGKQVVFRVYIDYPGRPSGLPDWLRDCVRMTRHRDHGGGESPDYEAPALVEGLERLVAALGRRYDADPRVAFVELGLLGYWGEWHTWPTARLMASPRVETRVIDAYHGAFPGVGLMARYARDHAGRQDWLGFHDDMLPEDTDNGQDWSFLAGLRKSGRLDNWRVAPIGGEMVPHAARQWLDDAHFPQTMALVERAHFSWVGPYCPALERDDSPRFLERSVALVRRLGYQFRWDEVALPGRVEPGQPLRLTLTGVNEGVAPFYGRWPAEVALIEPNTGRAAQRVRLADSPRSWLPGAIRVEAAITPAVPPGSYLVGLGIIDPRGDRPGVAFANRLDDRGGWAILGSVAVGDPAAR